MRSTLGIDTPQSSVRLTLERQVRARLLEKPLPRPTAPTALAAELVRWTAAWIADVATERNGLVVVPGTAGGVYWPNPAAEGLGVSADAPGRLSRVSAANVDATLDAYIEADRVSENGWPHPLAAADHFRDAIKVRRRDAFRQLELLLAGLATGALEAHDVEHVDRGEVSLERLIQDHRHGAGTEEWMDLAACEVRFGQDAVAFNSPQTLLCPVPGLPDDVWSRLWADVTGLAGDWRSASPDWGRSEPAIQEVRAWLEAQKRLRRTVTPPSWTSCFADVPPKGPFGVGRRVRVDWDGPAEVLLPGPRDRPFSYDLPAAQGDAGHVQRWRAHGGFEMVDFEAPDRESPVHGIWRGHLEALQRDGEIVAFAPRRRNGGVRIIVLSPAGEHRVVVLHDTVLLDRPTLMVSRLTPLSQDPVTRRRGRDALYPALPLKSVYLDLVETANGQGLLRALKRGEDVAGDLPPVQLEPRAGGTVATWTLRMRGCPDVLPFALQVPPPESFHKAHWMLWPKFRFADGDCWRAYYVYERCTDPRLHLDTLWLHPETNRVHTTRNEDPDRAIYPVRFDTRERTHVGGPPVAFCARLDTTGEEQGIYLAHLVRRESMSENVRVGVDFGTSHTVAAVAVGSGRPEPVDFAPELGEVDRGGLSLHISENREHVDAPFDEGLLSLGLWLPTYMRGVPDGELAGLLPSELLTTDTLETARDKGIAGWQPGSDVVIPTMGIAREDVVAHLIADFKWNMTTDFRGHESQLRQIYLDLVVELVAAELVDRYGRPKQPEFTFTYPLRTPDNDVDEYQHMLDGVMQRARRSLGMDMRLHDGVGLYDESHAAKGGTDRFGDVCVVGDLGGGTLDMLITAFPRDDIPFDDLADSVRLGGNLLLGKLAADPDAMPRHWTKAKADRETHLRAWMRAKGSSKLFGANAGESPMLDGLGLKGFEKPALAGRARELIDRYFYLIVEFMARNLVAYLGGHWHPKVAESVVEEDRPEASIMVYLRGNGWRLWHGSDDYGEIERVIGERIRKRSRQLWQRVPAGRGTGGLPSVQWSEGHAGDEHPKKAPVRQVVGKSQPHRQVRDAWFSHALVDLTVLGEAGRRGIVSWYSKVPFRTGGKGGTVQLDAVSPPLPLRSPGASRGLQIDDLSAEEKREINRQFREDGLLVGDERLDYRAPVASWVWEAAFRSDVLWKSD